ncbi:MAG: hypothetical protein WKF74_15010 [Pyrinomonadaceae bacterium]
MVFYKKLVTVPNVTAQTAADELQRNIRRNTLEMESGASLHA